MTTIDPAARLAAREPDGRRPQVMYQRWESLLFLHWRLPAARIQATLPQELTVDTFNGDAFIGVVPFFMRNVRPVGVPTMPWISDFQELNVRTYVFDPNGTPGVWFYSLDCNQPLAVIAARALTGLEYRNAEMSAMTGEFIDYTCRRPGSDELAQYRYRGVGEPRDLAPDSLEFFLLERYYLFARRAGSLVRGQVSHAPYRPRDVEVQLSSALPARLDGFTELPDAPEHVCFVDGFDVNIYATEKLA
ncbi:MAG: YqjF family protein [Chthoniobacterales bacterium]